MRDTVLPAASGGNEEMAASHVCAWLRKVQLSSCPGNFIFVTVIRLPIVYATLLYSSQLGTSLSVQQIALDSAFSHQEKKKFERRASLLKTAAEPNVAETALIDAFSAARGETGFTVAAGRLVSPALRHVFLFPPPPLPSVPPFILPPHLEHCCVATETRCATLCAARGGCAATWLELSLHSSLGSWRERLQCGAAVVLCPHSVAQKKKKKENGGSALSLVVEFSVWKRFLGTCFNFAPFIPGFVEEDETGGGWWAVFLRVRHISFLFFFSPFPLIFSMIENLGRGASGIG